MKAFPALLGVCLVAAVLPLSAPPLAAEEKSAAAVARFHPPGMWIWDNWFVHDGEQWHAFYLQLPKAVGVDRRWKDNDFYKHVGHATSSDLRAWRDEGPAWCALSGTWNDRHIATGSITRHGGKWWMAYTGRGTKGDGVGLAVSEDLKAWRHALDKPLFALTGTWGGAVEGGVFESPWKEETRRWVGISDPFLLPEPIDGWHFMVLCSRVLDVPVAESGCLTLVRSRDLLLWERPEILAWPRCFERMETPQLWTRKGRWYLSFGGVFDAEWIKSLAPGSLPAAVEGRKNHQNYLYRLDQARGPADEARLAHVPVPPGHYIMKVLPESAEKDVAIFTHMDQFDSGISIPYPVIYDAEGGFHLPLASP